ncbi:MAG TPA: hypothetical protein VNG04_13370, partial [Candidatus Acidoferrum sp.]|nr:hypothetical protein [Candidatus Acidoferrum sp.]
MVSSPAGTYIRGVIDLEEHSRHTARPHRPRQSSAKGELKPRFGRRLRPAFAPVLACLVAAGMFAATGAIGRSVTAAGTVLFSDNFASDTAGQPPTGWTVVAGTWTVGVDVTNVLKQTATDTSTGKSIFAGSPSGATAWTDYSTQVQVKPGSTNWNIGYTLNTRYSDDNNAYSLVLKNGNAFYFGKKVAGVWTTFTSGTFAYNTSTWYTLELDTAGTSIRAFINGNQVGSVWDSSFSSGAVDLMARYTSEFNNVVVTQMAPLT